MAYDLEIVPIAGCYLNYAGGVPQLDLNSGAFDGANLVDVGAGQTNIPWIGTQRDATKLLLQFTVDIDLTGAVLASGAARWINDATVQTMTYDHGVAAAMADVPGFLCAYVVSRPVP